MDELDQFFNVTLELLCVANTDGYFLRLNPPWEKVLGYSREDLMAKPFLEFIHPDDLERTRQLIMFDGMWRAQEDLDRHLRYDEYRNVLLVVEMAEEKPEIIFNPLSDSTDMETIEKARGSEF